MIVTTKAKVEAESITFTLTPSEARDLMLVLIGAAKRSVPGYGIYSIAQIRDGIASFLDEPKISTYKVDS